MPHNIHFYILTLFFSSALSTLNIPLEPVRADSPNSPFASDAGNASGVFLHITEGESTQDVASAVDVFYYNAGSNSSLDKRASTFYRIGCGGLDPWRAKRYSTVSSSCDQTRAARDRAWQCIRKDTSEQLLDANFPLVTINGVCRENYVCLDIDTPKKVIEYNMGYGSFEQGPIAICITQNYFNERVVTSISNGNTDGIKRISEVVEPLDLTNAKEVVATFGDIPSDGADLSLRAMGERVDNSGRRFSVPLHKATHCQQCSSLGIANFPPETKTFYLNAHVKGKAQASKLYIGTFS